jgi:dihydropteroate synthase
MPFAPRPHVDWRLRTRTLALGQHTCIMGILNVTPDSFSDGGHFYSPANETERALTQALLMLDHGAHILDIGGESTRPNATPLSPAEEQSRILPVIEAILKERPNTLLSIDTYHASTAHHAIAAGAEIINDVSGHTWDPAMSTTCTQLACGVVLMHSRGTPQTWKSLSPLPKADLLPAILNGLGERIAHATTAGIPRDRIVVDPGFGFGKIGDENYTLHAHLDALHTLKLPILSGTSRKGFLAKTIAPINNGVTPPLGARLHATTASNVAAILSGAHILRVHDVLPALEAAAIADAILHAL